MIHLGATAAEKRAVIAEAVAGGGLRQVKILTSAPWEQTELPGEVSVEVVTYEHLIEYVYFYRLLQEIDAGTLVVVDECLRTRDRGDLTYNCIRRYLNQAGEVIVFQALPMVWSAEDWLILFDWETDSRWRQSGLGEIPRGEAGVILHRELTPRWEVRELVTPPALQGRYERTRDRLFEELSAPGNTRDPHVIPRTLHLLGGALRAANAPAGGRLLVRNQRLRLERADSYGSERAGERYTVVDLPHDRKSFAQAIATTHQTIWPVISTSLAVDRWYVEQYEAWSREVERAYATALSG